MKMRAYLMMGIPGSGKSTYIREHLSGVPVASRDAIRFSLIGQVDDYFSQESIEPENINISRNKTPFHSAVLIAP